MFSYILCLCVVFCVLFCAFRVSRVFWCRVLCCVVVRVFFCVRSVSCFVLCLSCFVVCFYRFVWYFELLLRIFRMSCILVVYAPSYYFPLSSQIPGLECSKARFPFPPPPLNFYRTGASTSLSPPRLHPFHRWSLKNCWWWILSGRESSFVQSSICW